RLSMKRGGWPIQAEGILGGTLRELRHKELSDNPLTKTYQQWMKRASKAGMRIYFYRLKGMESSLHEMEASYKALQGFGEVEGGKAKAGVAYHKGVKAVAAANKYIEDVNLAIDNVTRLAAFRSAVELLEAKAEGLTQAQKIAQNLTQEAIDGRAAIIGRDATVDFNQRGTLGPQMNALWVFSNATVQAAAIGIKAMRSRRVQKLMGGMVVTGFLLSELSFWFSEGDDGEEDWYSELLENEKHVLQTNWVYPNPWSNKGY
ncbi:unnamed protein product, partial [marine sediment metagenome]